MLLIAAATVLISSSAAAPSPVRYHIEASVDGGDITGRETIEIDPIGTQPLDEVVLFLFPNLLSERLQAEKDSSKVFYLINPARWAPGSMELTSLTLADGTSLTWTGATMTRPDGGGGSVQLPTDTAVRATLPAPSTGTVTLTAEFKVHVPERFGSFARRRGELFLRGGWYPEVAPRNDDGGWQLDGPPPRTDLDASLDVAAREWVLLGPTLSKPDEAGGGGARRTVTVSVRSRPQLLLVTSPKMFELDGDGVSVLQPHEAKRYAKRERRTAASARTWLTRQGWIAEDAPVVPMIEAPITRELVLVDAPVAVISSRSYRVWPPMQRYHDLHVARAEIAALMRERVYALEPGDDASWVLQAVSWELAQRWQATAHAKMRDVRDYARPLSFLPEIDIVLNTPDFPFASEYYGNFYATDVARDDPQRFDNLRPPGTVAWEKLRDLVGAQSADEVMNRYLRGDAGGGGFRAVAARVLGRDLDSFFEQWRAPLPRVDYALGAPVVSHLPDGRWMSRVPMEEKGDDVSEPVTVRAHSKAGDDDGTWDSSERKGSLLLFTPSRPTSWQIDPLHRLLQTALWNDRYPPTYHLLLQYLFVDYDFKLNRADAGISFSLERSNDLRNEVDFDGFHRLQSTGATIGFLHSAGPFTYYRGLKHRFGVSLVTEELSRNFAVNGLHVVNGFDPTASKVRATVGAELTYRYDSRDDWRFSRGGSRVFAGVESGVGVQGSRTQYQFVEIDSVHQTRLSDNHVLAEQLDLGTFFATKTSAVPLSKLFFLGGIDDLRGLSAPEIVGPTKLLSSLEWRWYFLHDLDVDLWFARLRGLQGAVFADAGYIAPRTDAVPAFTRWIYDAGYGLRVHYAFLGVRPMILRLDLAQRLDDLQRTRKPDLRFYVGAGQSF